jgi:hypothetical protein
MLRCINETASRRPETLLVCSICKLKEGVLAVTLRIDRLAMGAAFALLLAIIFGAI